MNAFVKFYACKLHSFVILLFLIVVLSIIVTCSPLNQPANGMIDCLLRGDNIANLGESCTFSCDNGFMLRGSVTRTCQNDSSWSGIETTCLRGMLHSDM